MQYCVHSILTKYKEQRLFPDSDLLAHTEQAGGP